MLEKIVLFCAGLLMIFIGSLAEYGAWILIDAGQELWRLPIFILGGIILLVAGIMVIKDYVVEG